MKRKNHAESRRIRQTKNPDQTENPKQKNQIKFLSKGTLIIVMIIFLCFLGLWGQHLRITYLDQEVKTLTEDVNNLRSENDAIEGQLTQSQNDRSIKTTARSYGMRGVSASQKVVETITEQEINERLSEKNRWYYRLFE